MKKFIMRVLTVPFIPLIAFMASGHFDYEAGVKRGFWWCLRLVWRQWWVD